MINVLINEGFFFFITDAPKQEKLRNLPRDPDVIVPIIPNYGNKRKNVKKR